MGNKKIMKDKSKLMELKNFGYYWLDTWVLANIRKNISR